jgi:hypothetical protein
MTAKVPTIDSGTARLGMIVDRLANGDRAIVEDVEVHGGRQLLAEARQERPDGVDDLDAVRAGLALDRQDHRALVVVPAGDLVGLHAVDDAPELLEPHR